MSEKCKECGQDKPLTEEQARKLAFEGDVSRVRSYAAHLERWAGAMSRCGARLPYNDPDDWEAYCAAKNGKVGRMPLDKYVAYCCMSSDEQRKFIAETNATAEVARATLLGDTIEALLARKGNTP